MARPDYGHHTDAHNAPASDCGACRLRQHRELRRLSQAQMCRLIPSTTTPGPETPIRSYSSWERGERPVPAIVLAWLDCVRLRG